MVGKCSIKVVKDILTELGIEYICVNEKGIEIMGELSEERYNALDKKLREYDLSLIKTKQDKLSEQVCTIIIGMIKEEDGHSNESNSEYIERKMGYGYRYLARIFPISRGITIQDFTENYIVKEAKILIIEGELSFDEIAGRLHFNYPSFFSRLFKKVEGCSPSEYKKKNHKK